MNIDAFPNPEKLEVRAEIATEKDIEAIKKLRLEAVEESPASFGEDAKGVKGKRDKRWKEIVLSPTQFVVLGKKGEELIGMLSAKEDEYLSKEKGGEKIKNGWYIRWGYIKPEFRRMPAGFAIKGLQACLEEIKRRGGESAVLMVKAENENKKAIIKIGQKFGFEIIEGILPEGSVFMHLDLTKK